MPSFDNPFDPDSHLGHGCTCGRHGSQAAHDQASASPCPQGEEALADRLVETAVVQAFFPTDASRRRFLSAVGAGTALAAISTLFPLGAAKALAKEIKGPLEKKQLKIGFVPITCATPIIMAGPMGFYAKQRLEVSLIKTAGWAVVRDKVINREYDASHMLSPMPLAMSMGLGSKPVAVNVAAIENINGQAITMHIKHKDRQDPRQWKGMRFGIPLLLHP